MPANHDAEASADRDSTNHCQPMAAEPNVDPEWAIGHEIAQIQRERRELDRRMRELIGEIRTRKQLLDELDRRNHELRERSRQLVDVQTVNPWLEVAL